MKPHTPFHPDPAAELGIALSLIEAAKDYPDAGGFYNGHDGFMREAMRVAREFEAWACKRVDFGMLEDVWPYMLEGRFASGAARSMGLTDGELLINLGGLDADSWPKIAAELGLPLLEESPVAGSDDAPLPADSTAGKPKSA